MLLQQISGTINLSLPLIILYNLQPLFLLTLPGRFFCSFLIGAYIWYINYQQLKTLENSLLYTPTDKHQEMFRDLIEECQINPDNVILKYAYTNLSIAMTAGSTIIIDPLTFHDVEDDPQAIKVLEIFKVHIEPTLSPVQKERISALHQILTPGAQRFIFKHELGHIIQNFAFKKLFALYMIAFFATYSGIIATVMALQIHGFIAILAGMFVGGIVDLFLTYVSNVTFKLHQEKSADAFAIKYSSDEDIQAAARFFENHQAILDQDKDPSHFLSYIPSTIMTGYQDGFIRAIYLLKLMNKK